MFNRYEEYFIIMSKLNERRRWLDQTNHITEYEREEMTAAIKRLVPAKFRGEIAPNYFVDPKNGEIWSNKRGGFKNLKWKVSGNSPYPAVVFRINDESFTVRVHRIVAETIHNFPIPPGVSEKEWKRTPVSVKRLFDQFWEVNHKDHDRSNFKPKNLEWVSRKENVEKYHQHVAKRG